MTPLEVLPPGRIIHSDGHPARARSAESSANPPGAVHSDGHPAHTRSAESSADKSQPAGGATICPYCGVGCGLKVEVRNGAVSRVRGDKEHAGTRGMLCRKA